jgi:hypothetical protein
MLRKVSEEYEKRGIRLLLVNVHDDVRDVMDATDEDAVDRLS